MHELKERLTQSGVGRKVMVINEDRGVVTARVYPKTSNDSELARTVGEAIAAQKWVLEELHTEEGRLDEVFRNITLPETVVAQEESK